MGLALLCMSKDRARLPEVLALQLIETKNIKNQVFRTPLSAYWEEIENREVSISTPTLNLG